MAKGYTKIEGVEFNEIFAPVAHLWDIKLLLGLFYLVNLKIY